jgi:hypothetical protein
MATATSIPLSNNDLQILNTIFDPESSPETQTIQIDSHLPPDPHILDRNLLTTLQNRELSAIRLIESYASQTQDEPNNSNADVSSDRRETYLKAHTILTDIITHHPDYASAYNNRAQLHRWCFGGTGLPSLTLSNSSSSSSSPCHYQQQLASVAQSLADLATAIKLVTPQSQSATVSPQQAKILASAWTQRGAVFLSVVRGLREAGLERLPGVALGREGEMEYGEDGTEEWKWWDRMRFEEEGSRCFYVAGLYGSEVGRAMAVMANPYARLCGAIVKEAIRGESGKD